MPIEWRRKKVGSRRRIELPPVACRTGDSERSILKVATVWQSGLLVPQVDARFSIELSRSRDGVREPWSEDAYQLDVLVRIRRGVFRITVRTPTS